MLVSMPEPIAAPADYVRTPPPGQEPRMLPYPTCYMCAASMPGAEPDGEFVTEATPTGQFFCNPCQKYHWYSLEPCENCKDAQ